jgi:hypothetical protein
MFVSSSKIEQNAGKVSVVNVWNTNVLRTLSLLPFKSKSFSYSLLSGDFVLLLYHVEELSGDMTNFIIRLMH